MKYGKTERISGIVILLALLAIFVPWLMSDPAPREERPQPSFIIEQPVAVERRDVPAPERPASINDPILSSTPSDDGEESLDAIEATPRLPQTDQIDTSREPPTTAEAAGSSEPDEPATPTSDPIADLVAANNTSSGTASSGSGSSGSAPSSPSPSSAQGEWAVQVGSFGDASNAGRLSEQLSGEGFTVYQRQRDNNMTTVFVGPYATSEDGEAAMTSIKERANVQGLLVRVRD
ncbi:SPOR domain-containing protein [Halomonas sp. NPDC076908]|uniref:SPOR domain-containing protein n=1 Tax=Halomonas sp. NPDC076908 TaxID=3390567 RepID=UPI003D01DD1A|nr:SPOR domain-containing protein [Gammaproteobacteria bacterium]